MTVTDADGAGGTRRAPGAGVTIGSATVLNSADQPLNPTGLVNVTEYGANNVTVYGGTEDTINIAGSGNVLVGTIGPSLAYPSTEPTTAVTVNDTSDVQAGTITVYAAKEANQVTANITSTALLGGAITVGGITPVGGVNTAYAPGGDITIANTPQTAYGYDFTNGGPKTGVNAPTNVIGGADVSVTSNTGDINVGAAAFNSGVPVAGADPSGKITVTDSSDLGNVTAYGGTNVSVTAAGGGVTVGGDVSKQILPTGTVDVTETRAFNQYDFTNPAPNGPPINVDGGNGVTVTALGQDVYVGSHFGTAGAQVVTETGVLTGVGLGQGGIVEVDGGSTVNITTTGNDVTVGKVSGANTYVASGAVNIQDNFGSGNATDDNIAVLGGTTVGVTVNSADNGSILVGDQTGLGVNAEAALNAAGTALKNPAIDPTGNVTILNAQTNGATTTYGTGATNVVTNGGGTVSITGGSVGYVADAQSTIATGGADAGQAVGTSKLTTVVLDGTQTGGPVSIESDVLANLSALDNNVVGNAYTVTNNTAAHALALTIGNDSNTLNADGSTKSVNDFTVTDAKAGSVTVGDNGKASTSTLTLSAVKATALTLNDTAAATFSLAGDAALTTITANVTNAAGTVDLGDVSGLAKLATINATTSTGALKVEINPGVTSFNGLGSTGNETVQVDQNSLLHSDGTTYSNVIAGSGSNTIVANYAAATSDTALGANAHIKGFTTLALGTAATDGTSGQVFQPGASAVAKVDTITITQTGILAIQTGTTFTITITPPGGGAPGPDHLHHGQQR